MSYTQHLSAILNAIKEAKGWSQAFTYPCPERPNHVVFHSNLLSATTIERVVISDMASRGPKFVTQLAGTIVDHGNGTDHCQVLVPRGADPDADSVTISRSDWDSMSPNQQEEGLDVGNVITIVSDVSAEDTPPAAEVAAEAPDTPVTTTTHISESRPFPTDSHPVMDAEEGAIDSVTAGRRCRH